MTIKIESKKLKEFMDTVTLNSVIPTAILSFETAGLNIKLKNEANTIFNICQLNKEAFEAYNLVENQIGIKNTKLLSGILGSFTGVVEIDITQGLLTIFNKSKSASITTAEPAFVPKNALPVIPESLNQFDTGVIIGTEVFKNSMKNGTILNSEALLIDIQNKVLAIDSGDKGFDSITEKVPCEYKDVKSKFSLAVIKPAVDKFGEVVQMSILSTGGPIQFITQTDEFTARTILGPLGLEDDKPSPTAKAPVVEKAPEAPVVQSVETKQEEPKTETASSEELL